MTNKLKAEDTAPTNAMGGKVPRVAWNGWWGVVYMVLVFYLAQAIAVWLVLLFAAAKGQTQNQAIDWLNDSIPAQFFYVLLAETLTIGALYFFLRWQRSNFRAIGLKRPRWREVKYGLLAVLPYYVIYILTVGVVSAVVSGFDTNQTQEIGFTGAQGVGPLLLVFVSLVVLPPIVEEIMVRGFLYSSLRKVVPLGWAVFLTSLIFAGAHLPEGGDAGPLYIAAVDTFVLSLVLIYLREKTGSLWASITLHGVKNSVAFLLLFVWHVG